MLCMCGATDCKSCGPAQGYEVRRRPNGGYYNPVYCEMCEDVEVEEDEELCETCKTYVCPKCGSRDTSIGLRHEASALAPECWYNECTACEHQWGHS